jgi:hypothetical protein
LDAQKPNTHHKLHLRRDEVTIEALVHCVEQGTTGIGHPCLLNEGVCIIATLILSARRSYAARDLEQ